MTKKDICILQPALDASKGGKKKPEISRLHVAAWMRCNVARMRKKANLFRQIVRRREKKRNRIHFLVDVFPYHSAALCIIQ